MASFTTLKLREFAAKTWGADKKHHCAALFQLEQHELEFMQLFKDPTHVVICFKDNGMTRSACTRCMRFLKQIVDALLADPEQAQKLQSIKDINLNAMDDHIRIVKNVYNGVGDAAVVDESENGSATTDEQEEEMVAIPIQQPPAIPVTTTMTKQPMGLQIDFLVKNAEESNAKHDALARQVERLTKMVVHLATHANNETKAAMFDILLKENQLV
jgi:hypothetical protein